ncbi:MAG TPA: hypothetical protein VFG35_02695 [Actinoplanes sp.]|nr:hypothetical protein [Actinoplanes sp.]
MTAPAATAPMTFGQRDVMFYVDRVPHDKRGDMNQLRLWPVPPGTSRETVAAVLRLLAERHESLRTRFVGLTQIVDPGYGPAPEPDDDAWSTHADAVARMFDLGTRPFAFEREYAWRARMLVDPHGLPHYVAVSFSHVIIDRHSLDRLTRDFTAVVLDGPDAVAVPTLTPRELAREQHGDAWVSRRRRSLEYLWATLAGVPTPPEPTSGRIEAHRFSVKTSSLLAAAGTALGVSPQAIMLALGALIAGQLRGTAKPLVGVMASNRLNPAWNSMVTSLNQRTWLTLDLEADVDFPALARRASAASLTAIRHGCYDIDALVGIAEEAGRGSLAAVDCTLNMLTQDPGINCLPDPGPDGDFWVRPKSQQGSPVEIKVFQGTQQLRTDLRIDPRLCTPGELLGFLDWSEDQLALIAAGERPRVDRMRSSLG